MTDGCNRCGKCCFFPTGETNADGTADMRACPSLVIVGKGVYYCRDYGHRLGRIIGADSKGNVYRCVMYDSLSSEILGCPINKGGKPLIQIEIKGKRGYGAAPTAPILP